MTVSVSSSEPMTASEIVRAIGRKSFPSMRWKVRMGTYTVMMIRTAKVSGRATSTAASCTSWRTWGPVTFRSLRRRKMFSAMMTAPSTMIPKSMAPSESRFDGTPRRSMNTKANSSESGMVRATITAARML